MKNELPAIVKHMYDDQRAELKYRRDREFQIFSWSATMFIAMTAGLLFIDPEQESLFSAHPLVGRVVGSVVITGLALLSVEWQRVQWNRAARHQRVLARIADELGLFELRVKDGMPWYPAPWRDWGKGPRKYLEIWRFPNKMMATFLLSAVTLFTLWWPMLF